MKMCPFCKIESRTPDHILFHLEFVDDAIKKMMHGGNLRMLKLMILRKKKIEEMMKD